MRYTSLERIRKPMILFSLGLLALLLTSCSFGVSSVVQSEPTEFVQLDGEETIGQTFVSQFAGLSGIELEVGSNGGSDGDIHIHLRESAQSALDITSASIDLRAIKYEGRLRFAFPPQFDSFRKYYYVFLEYEGEGTLDVNTVPGDRYLDGALYVSHQPRDQQAIFSLTYHPGLALLGILREVGYWGFLFLVSLFLFVIPGLAILTLLLPQSSGMGLSWRMVLGSGISLALYPILTLLTYLMKVKLGAGLAWIPGILGVGIIAWKATPGLRATGFRARLSTWWRSSERAADLTALSVLAIIIMVRLFIIRVVDLPLWGDSLTHSMVSQLVVDHGGLFQSWDPYAELETFTYHFGFHTYVAIFHWITQIPVPQSTLWVGQIINVIAVASLFPIARKAGESKWAGTASLLIAGLILTLPNYYSNWGRYTQLSGQAMLASIILIARWLSRREKIELVPSLFLGLLMGGLGLIHYRVLIFAIPLVVVIFILQAIKLRARSQLVNFSISGICGILLFLPWFSQLIGGKILGNAIEQVSTPATTTSTWIQQYNLIGELTSYLPLTIWILLAAGSLWGLLKKNSTIWTLVIWGLTIFLIANPQILGLPGQGILSNFAIFIAAYLPAALIIGTAVGWSLSALPVLSRFMPVVIVLLSILGGFLRLSDLEPQPHSLATRPDIRAFAWITEHTPEEARFLTNGFFAYDQNLVVGSDGGWWLALLTKRGASLPPILYGVEKGPGDELLREPNLLYATLESEGFDSDQALQMLKEQGISHVYIGQRQGRVNYPGPLLLNPEQMLLSRNYRLIYNQDRVWIFEVDQ